ncbi:MAG: cell wall hydrolase [Rhizobiaceae bacterium]|nr:cell wall hydrolase [Rhizobiaceae bacterium]
MSAEECMTRVMYFESNRSSEEGMIAVGTVVLNRMESGKYPGTVCGVVGQKNQFAPGVLSKPMGKGADLAQRTAKKVLRGAKHARVGKAMFFHTAGHSFSYTNMHYVAIAGGNAFYEKRRDASSTQADILRRDVGSQPPTRRRDVEDAGRRPGRQPVFDPSWTSPATSDGIVAPGERAPSNVQRLPTPGRSPAIPSGVAGSLEPMSIEDLIGRAD